MLYSLRIYRRDGECLFEQHWTSGSTAHVVDHRTTFGLLFALKAFANQLTPIMLGELENEPIRSFCTEDYKLHYLETPTGLRFIMITDTDVGDQRETLQRIYALYVAATSLNATHVPGTPLHSPLFVLQLHEYVRTLPFAQHVR
ncbi:Trafficking protein particle complex subunit [Plasmodiophora brassicae]|uniref:Trafficking protein particle complex subunit n=1 Tax=Plasmodiophora brassicae TaxID=37360 RepID=A0A0G4J2I4_PLABS|nr:hypothetical protein PBRA_002112 [Plasmodiophora brassicae]